MFVYRENQKNKKAKPRVHVSVILEAFSLVWTKIDVWLPASVLYTITNITLTFGLQSLFRQAGLLPRHGSGVVISLPMYVFGMILRALVISLVTAPIIGGLYRMALQQIRGQRIRFKGAFSPLRLYPAVSSTLFLSVLANYAIFVLLILLVNPGFTGMSSSLRLFLLLLPTLVFLPLFMFALLLVIDQGMSAWKALHKSVSILRRCYGSALFFFVVSSLAASSGTLLCFVGLFYTLPIHFVATALVYQDFLNRDLLFPQPKVKSFAPTIEMPLPPPTTNDDQK